eukprot:COSAG02_NODE_5205_length_4543_cov_37.419667_2_plen_77_part_00
MWSVGAMLQLRARQTREYSRTLVWHVSLGKRDRKPATIQYQAYSFSQSFLILAGALFGYAGMCHADTALHAQCYLK